MCCHCVQKWSSSLFCSVCLRANLAACLTSCPCPLSSHHLVDVLLAINTPNTCWPYGHMQHEGVQGVPVGAMQVVDTAGAVHCHHLPYSCINLMHIPQSDLLAVPHWEQNVISKKSLSNF